MIKLKVFNLNDDIKYENQERILVKTGSDKNLLQLARKDSGLKIKYKELLANDYILYFHDKEISRFCKREHVNKLFDGLNLEQYKNIFYRLSMPQGRKVNNKVEKKLIVIFAKMPGANQYDSPKIPHRMLPPFFDDLERSLVKNVYTMRIMDLNVSHGSHYINTVNYPDYEQEIQESIENVRNYLDIDKKNVVFYGVSRGGAGAIVHGTSMDYKTLAVDPILNIGDKLEANDRRLLKGLRKEDLVPMVNENLSVSNKFQKVIICSENVKLYYEQSMRINKDKAKVINMKDDKITSHPEVSPNTVPEQLMILNNLLSGVSV
ncbi:XcbB/CpsF family capsular polysaccharide biosynthesis protein [Mammaliicoccus vitulinus]|uniref:XcbB/CpsF family capsular polysaccharide biosynthesis protein n=2 Tax=Mammaliicoccus vitulinus TaxID=71237 RepID=A0ABX7HIR6_9STAP|nr:XcbB/CpsF family capsular polysaccharide biosynthesis protein [Mammaliicoccus vitulinus]